MLLRSSSTPIFNSWLSHSKDRQPEPEPLLHLPRTRSVNLSSLHTPVVDPTKKTTQFLVESDLQNPPIKPNKKNPIPQIKRKQSKNRAKEGKEQEEELKPIPMSSSSFSTQRLFSSSGLGEKLMDDEAFGVGKKESVLQTLTGSGGVGSNGGKICGGGGGSKESDGGDQSGFFENNNNNNNNHHGINNTDAYYQKMIQADPSNALLLSNYAKFLKEVRA